MKTYYIVRHVEINNNVCWRVHERGILSTFNYFGVMNSIPECVSFHGPDDCENHLRRFVNPIKPVIVRVVKIKRGQEDELTKS